MKISVIRDTFANFKKSEKGENAYLFEYLDRVKDKTFSELPFSIIDALILSILPYYRFDFMNLKENKVLKLFEATHLYMLNEDLYLTAINNEPRNPFLKELAKTNRFKDLLLFNFSRAFSKSDECQFQAISIELNKNTVFIAFSGTDSSLTGIKEDMNMSYLEEIPSQQEALEYIKDKSFKKYKNIYLGGHSKGGYLAIFSAMTMKEKQRLKIKNIFNFDGPGFPQKTIEQFHAEDIYDKVLTIVPDMSIFGMIWNKLSNIIVIESNRYSVFQHDPFSWKIDKTNHFLYKNYVIPSSIAINESVNLYMEKLDVEQRRKFVDLLWFLISNTFTSSIKEFRQDYFNKSIKGIKVFSELSTEDKKVLKSHLGILAKAMMQSKKSYKNVSRDIDYLKLRKLDIFNI